MLEKLKKSLQDCPVVKKGNYDYFVHPITDGVPEVAPALLEEIVDAVLCAVASKSWDKIVTAEAMGIPIATALSLRTRKPFVIIRKKKYGLAGEVEVLQKTGYSEAKMYINGLKRGDKVLFVDDVISTGGTLVSIIKALKNMGVEIADVVIVFNKHKNISAVERELGMKIKTLMSVDIVDGKAIAVLA